ncbi:MAG: aldehyde dehydrogenase family protein [Desulfovibrio sp.]
MIEKLTSYNPVSDKALGSVKLTKLDNIPTIVSKAQLAAKNWGKLVISERVRIIKKAYSRVEPYLQELSELLCKEMGKDIRRGTSEVHGTVFGGTYMADIVQNALSPHNTGGSTWVEYKPLGVAAIISPWNYPLAMANNLLIPALVAGNTVVFKPSEETPLIADTFVTLLNEALPKHVLQIVHGDEKQGKALVESDVNIIGFTGSMKAGRDIMARSASSLKRLVMELGGNDPMIVMADADLMSAARFAVASSFENAGQMCTATERIYVDKEVSDKFESLVTDIAFRYKVGPWDLEGVNIGPIINKRQHEMICHHIADAEAKGARIILGSADQKPPFIQPTVITDMTPDMLLEQEETFGPVIAISSFTSIEEAVNRANDSKYGLGAVVFGGPNATTVADKLEAGMIGVNQGVGGMGDAPWVGAKQSGYGFHGSPEGHRLFAQTRTVNR